MSSSTNDIHLPYRPLPTNIPKFKNPDRNPTNPSIPSKFDSKKLYVNNSGNGFGNRVERFKPDENFLPGPGLYFEDKNDMIKKGPSISKKGFSNAFLSKKDRLGSVILNNNVAGPGYYDPKMKHEITFYDDDLKRPTRAFAHSEPRQPYEDPLKKTKPGPGEYHPEVEPGPPKYIKKKSSATFLSRQSDRDIALTIQARNGVPGTASYCPDPISQSEQKVLWSKNTFRRFQDLGVDNKVPGPGNYFNEEQNKLAEMQRVNSSQRIIGRYPDVNHKKKSKTIPHTFGADVDRFKHSFMGRLDLASELPGPGWYAPLEIIPGTVPEEEQQRASVTGMMASFKSALPLREDIVKPISQRPPGPAYYNPQPITSKSFSVRTSNKWI